MEATVMIAATIDLPDAARRTWDAVVIGAGPAGSMAARELARRGCAVLLIDRASFPRWKVCGCCLNTHALAALESVGLSPVMARSGAVPLTAFRLAAAGYVAEVPLCGGVSLSREAFDAALVAAAVESGAAFLPQTLASLERPLESYQVRWVDLQQGSMHQRIAARVVVAADGLGGKSTARAEVGQTRANAQARIGAGVVAEAAPAFYSPGRIFMVCGRGGYLGLVRLEDGRLNLAAALDPTWMRVCGRPGRAAEALLAESGWPAVPNLAELNWRGTPALTRQARQHAGERLFLIGDAAGYVEPFTGEGMAWALAAGRAAAPLAAQAAERWHPQLARQWELEYRRLLGRRQLVCQAIAEVLRSPGLMRTALRLLARAPALAMPMTHYLGARKIGRTGGEVLSFPSPCI
jgi:menaquinone-9 beta-reductase